MEAAITAPQGRHGRPGGRRRLPRRSKVATCWSVAGVRSVTRIIGGRFGGRRIAVPRSVRTRTRPTTDRVREALFNVLAARLDLAGARCSTCTRARVRSGSRRSPAVRPRRCSSNPIGGGRRHHATTCRRSVRRARWCAARRWRGRSRGSADRAGRPGVGRPAVRGRDDRRRGRAGRRSPATAGWPTGRSWCVERPREVTRAGVARRLSRWQRAPLRRHPPRVRRDLLTPMAASVVP